MYLKACLFETEYGGDGRGTFGRAGHQMHGRGAQQWNYISQDPCVSFYVGKRRGIGADFADSPNPEHLQLTVLCVTVTTQWETVGMQRLCLAPVNRFQSTSSTETGIYIKELIGYLPNETLDQVLEGSQSHLSFVSAPSHCIGHYKEHGHRATFPARKVRDRQVGLCTNRMTVE